MWLLLWWLERQPDELSAIARRRAWRDGPKRLLWLFPGYRYVPGRYIAWVFAWYGLSKLLEHFDARVFELLGYTISGHTLKHLAAAASAFVVLWMLLSRHRIRNRQPGRENSVT